MVRTRQLVLAAFIVALLAAPVAGYSLALSPQDIQEALAFGERTRNPQTGSLQFQPDTPYGRTLDIEAAPERARVVWITSWLYVAAMRASLGRVPTSTEIAQLIATSRNAALVTVVTHTKADIPPREIRILVQRPDGSILRADRTDAVRVGQTAAGLYINNIRAWFRYSDGLNPTETVKVIIGWGARSLSVEFNLAELR